MPTVSIIVPVYNTASYLSRCIESLVNQTYSDLQIILIDDGSTDESGAIADEWQTKDPRIEVYHQQNQGLSCARNTGLVYAKGEYLCFIDSDDYIEAQLVQMLVENTNEDVDYIQFGYKREDIHHQIIEENIPHGRYQLTSACLRLYKREFLLRHHLTFTPNILYEDVVFSIQLWALHPNVMILGYSGYHYTLRETSITSKRNKAAEKVLFSELHSKFREATSVRVKVLILYTMWRLKLHFAWR